MKSGIYKLTFNNGDFYIGKSVDIRNRWKQHWDKFQKGTAAANMQRAFNTYGYPTQEALFYCHKDHIDLAEEMFIFRLKPPLNGTYPADPFEGLSNAEVQQIAELMCMSTLEHIRLIKSLQANKYDLLGVLKDRDIEISRLERMVSSLCRIRTEEETNEEILKLRSEIEQLQAKTSWWQRLFN